MPPARKFPSITGSSKASSVTSKKIGDEKRSPELMKEKRGMLATTIPFQIWTRRRRMATSWWSASACPRIAGHANEDAAIGANNEASATALVPLVSRHGGTVLDKPPRRAGRIIMIAGLVVVGGLVSVIGVKTVLLGSVDSTNRAGAPSASPPTRKEKVNRSQSALPKAETGAPATKPMEKESAPKNDATPHPSSAAPAGPSDAAIIAAPPAETPESSKPNPVAPGAEHGKQSALSIPRA